jgi:UDP-N-acetylglucosamine diphosphorylase/glucosamine-1-phosphate N-acetyltransferase
MLYVYEDPHAMDLEPLSLTWATFELRCGACSHIERIRRVVGGQSLTLIVRPHLAAVVQERYPELPVNPDKVEAGLWLNGVALWDDVAWERLQGISGYLATGDRLTGGNLSADESTEFYRLLQSGKEPQLSPVATDGPQLLMFLWDHFLSNEEVVIADFDRWYKDRVTTSFGHGVHVIGDQGVYLGEGVTIDPAVVLDTRHGPIIIDDGTSVGSHVVIAGPTYLGPKCKIWPYAFLEEVSLGPVCRAMGQVEGTIMQGFTNKQHDGFLGHAYLGSWVNLGAGTTNSDLKNNYGDVRVTVNGRSVNSGSRFVGCFLGDHAKSAIGTLFYTGTRVGVCANVFGDVTPPKVVPSFAWGGDGKVRYDLEKCLDTMAVVKSRRGEELTEAERTLYTRLYGEDV